MFTGIFCEIYNPKQGAVTKALKRLSALLAGAPNAKVKGELTGHCPKGEYMRQGLKERAARGGGAYRFNSILDFKSQIARLTNNNQLDFILGYSIA